MSMTLNLYLTDELALKLTRVSDKEKKKPTQIAKFALIRYLKETEIVKK